MLCIICEIRLKQEGKKTCGNALCLSAHLRVCEARLDAARARAAGELCSDRDHVTPIKAPYLAADGIKGMECPECKKIIPVIA
jgi:hypothetical protein